MKKIILLSFFTLPFSVLFILITDAVMVSMMGGIATTKGFPFPYYKDIWSTSQIDYDIPLIKYVNLGLIYLSTTFIGLKFFKKSGFH